MLHHVDEGAEEIEINRGVCLAAPIEANDFLGQDNLLSNPATPEPLMSPKSSHTTITVFSNFLWHIVLAVHKSIRCPCQRHKWRYWIFTARGGPDVPNRTSCLTIYCSHKRNLDVLLL